MALFYKKKKALPERLPVHIAIVMDGNGRWAKRRGLPRSAGHSAGANQFRTITRYCNQIGIKYLTVYAFSTENWSRPQEEVNALMNLFKQYLEEALTDFREENIKTRFIGDLSAFNDELRGLIAQTEELSKDKTGLVLNIAMNYGGRDELTRAVRSIAKSVHSGETAPEDIAAETVAACLDTAGQPDPDLVIRPSGELRTSNFLIWQSAYAEYYFTPLLWPDFKTRDLDEAIHAYAKRSRRFGK